MNCIVPDDRRTNVWLKLNATPTKAPEDEATRNLLFGFPKGSATTRRRGRWRDSPETEMLADFGALCQKLLANEASAANRVLARARGGQDFSSKPPEDTLADRLTRLFGDVLPHLTPDDRLYAMRCGWWPRILRVGTIGHLVP